MRIPTGREPTHPGEMLRAEFLEPMGISQRELADAIHVPYQRVNELVNQKRGVTPSTALRLAKFLIYQRIIGSTFKPAGICIGFNNRKRTILNLSRMLAKQRDLISTPSSSA